MRLKTIQLTNYRRFIDTEVTFSPRFSAIVGVNGSGKTSLLSGMADALVAAFISGVAPWSHPITHEMDVRSERKTVEGLTRFEPCFPVRIRCTGEAQGNADLEWTITRKASPAFPDFDSGAHELARVLNESLNEFSPENPSPMFAYYRANRQWPVSALNTVAAATRRESRIDAFASWSDASKDVENMQFWIVAKYLQRLQSSNDSAKPFDSFSHDELAIVNGVLSSVVEGAKAFRFDMRDHALLIEWTDGSYSSFAGLSDGQRSAICLITDIVRRMCLLNPQLGAKVAELTPGVILIDELDVHLHPGWQSMMVRGLKATFPSIQFIVASHSPQVLGELEPDEIVILNDEGVSSPLVSYGMDSSRVLEVIMGVKARPPEVGAALDSLFELIERGDLETARQALAKLKSEAPGVVELGRAEALIRRKEILGR